MKTYYENKLLFQEMLDYIVERKEKLIKEREEKALKRERERIDGEPNMHLFDRLRLEKLLLKHKK